MEDKEILQMLEASIVNLLNKIYNDSWSVLIFQSLIWSFRRWAIHQLMMNESTDLLKDCIWDSHLELIRDFAPPQLKDFALIWLSPSNIGHRVDILEELNEYFLKVIDTIDISIKANNQNMEMEIAMFLDERLTEIIEVWLKDKPQYRIYPKADESPDTFSPARIYDIMRLILDEPVEPTPIEPPAEVPPTEPVEAPTEPPVETVKEAFMRRRSTRKVRPRQAPKTKKRKQSKAV